MTELEKSIEHVVSHSCAACAPVLAAARRSVVLESQLAGMSEQHDLMGDVLAVTRRELEAELAAERDRHAVLVRMCEELLADHKKCQHEDGLTDGCSMYSDLSDWMKEREK